MIKVAYIGIKGLPSKGGAERVVEGTVTRLNAKHKVSIYCSHRYTPKDTRLLRIKLIRIPCLPGKHLQPLSLFFFSAIHALLRGDYDLIHLHNVESCLVAPLLRLRYPVIATSHGPAYAREKWGNIAKLLLRSMDCCFAFFPHELTSVSLPLAKEYESKWKREVSYIPNGVENNLPINQESAMVTLKLLTG